MDLKDIKLTDVDKGLSASQVLNAKSNKIEDQSTKSYKKILQANIFSLFNAINVFLAFLVILTGSYRNMLFMGVVIGNALIGIFQEVRSKKKLDALALLNQQKAHVLRDGKIESIPVERIVENDLILLQAGDQICVDGLLVSGEVECNESLLTGESDAIHKRQGDSLYSGSYVEAGHGKMQAIHVGEDTYVHSILKHAKREKKYPSQLRDSIDTIIRFCTIILFPAGILLYLKSFFLSQ